MRPIQLIDVEKVAAVVTLAVMPRVSRPIFNGVTIPKEDSARIEPDALDRLRESYGDRPTIVCTVKGRRLLITVPCDPEDLEDLQADAEILQEAILRILGVATCLVCGGYNLVCECFDRADGVVLLPESVAGGEMLVH